MKINVLIIAPNTIVRQGLLMLLDADEGIRAHAADPKPESMLHEAKRFRPDIALFPVYAYDREVLTAIRRFQKAFPGVKLLLLLSELDEFLVMDSLQAGVDGILLDENNTDEKRLTDNLRYLYEDGYVLTGKIAKLMMNNFNAMYASEKQQLRRRLLTHGIHVSWRELDIMYLLMKNRSNKEMTQSLDLTEKTIRDYVSMAYKKLGINRRQEAVAFLQAVMRETQQAANDDDNS